MNINGVVNNLSNGNIGGAVSSATGMNVTGAVNSLMSGDIGGALDSLLGLLITPQRSIGTIYPDVTLREIGRDDMVVTDHPVEKGAPISDHAFMRPVAVELTYTWSDSTAGYEGYAKEIYESLLQLQKERKPLDISTGKRLYSNMLITSLQQNTDVVNEFALLVQCECREVIIAETQTVQGAPQKDQAEPKATAATQNTGTSQAQPVAPASNTESAVTNSAGVTYTTGGGF